MRIALAPMDGYNIIEGTADILCHCSTLTEAAAVLNYLNMKPLSALEKSIARQAVYNWVNEVKARKELKAAKKARQKANKQKKLALTEQTTSDQEETGIEVPTLPEI